MELVRFSAGKDVSGSSVTNKLVRPRMKCSSEGEESFGEQELSGWEEGEMGRQTKKEMVLEEKEKQQQQVGV